MKPNTRPALGRAPSRSLRILAVVVAALALALPFGAVPARAVSPAGWTTETTVAGAYHTRPAIARDATGHLGIAWQEADATPGIQFATDAAGPWATERISSGDDWTPDLVFDGDGAAHVVFARFGSNPGLYHATNATGSWVVTQLRTDVIPWSPSIAIDGAGKLHVAYASEGFTPGIWYLTNASGTWVPRQISSGTWDSEPSLALDGNGKVHIAFARYERPSPGLLLATNATGTWVTTRLTTNARLDDYPALVIDGAGKRHIAAVRYFADPPASLLYLTDASGAWVTSQLGAPAGGPGPGIPALGLDASGEPEIVVRAGYTAVADDTLWRYSDLPWGTPERLMTGTERDEGFPDIVRDATGRLAVAYRGAWHAPGIVLHREDPDDDTLIAASVLVGFPSLAIDQGDGRHLAVERYATDTSDGTSYATDASGAWTDEAISPTHGQPRMAVGGAPPSVIPEVAIPDRFYWDPGSGWESLAFDVPGGTRVAISTGAAALVYEVPGQGLRLVEPGSPETPLTSVGAPVDATTPAIDWDLELIVSYVSGRDLYAMYRSSTGWHDPQLVDGTSVWYPSMVVERNALGTGHIVYDRHDASGPGIWLASGGEWLGSWELRRLSRSWADSVPAITRDQENHLYVAWARACWGPSPGLYFATNRTGSWVTSQVVHSCAARDPSIALLADGRAVIAYTDPYAGIQMVGQGAAAGSASATTLRGPTRDIDEHVGRANDGLGVGRVPTGASMAPAGSSGHARHGSSVLRVAEIEQRFIVDR